MVKRVEIRLTANKKTWLRTEIKPEHLLLQLCNSFAGKWLEIFFYRQMVCPSYLYKGPDSSHEKISSNVVVKNNDLLVIMFFFQVLGVLGWIINNSICKSTSGGCEKWQKLPLRGGLGPMTTLKASNCLSA